VKLSILIPVYNERYLVGELVRRVLAAHLPEGMDRELVIVDDGSTDGTREILEDLAAVHAGTLRYVPHRRNTGKGGAIRTAIAHATGEFCIFQDADLEYDPDDYLRVVGPLVSGEADVVYGSRFLPGHQHRIVLYRHYLGNRLLTLVSNFFTNLNLSDMETCYKAFRMDVLRTIPIRSSSFALEPEITTKVAKRGLRVWEVPIGYQGRTYQEGKKIGLKDGFLALFTLLRYWVVDDLYTREAGGGTLHSLLRGQAFNRWMADTLRPWVRHRVLAMGTGIGNLSLLLMPRQRYVVSDSDEMYVRILGSLVERRRRMEVCRIDAARSQDFEPFRGEIDTIVCINVLEKTKEEAAALRNFHQTLEPGGRALVLVPQGRWLWCRLDETHGHLRRYDRADLRRGLEAAGFQVEKMLDFNRFGVVGWLIHGKLLSRDRIPHLLVKAFDKLVWLWRLLDPVLPWHGLSLAAVARKPE